MLECSNSSRWHPIHRRWGFKIHCIIDADERGFVTIQLHLAPPPPPAACDTAASCVSLASLANPSPRRGQRLSIEHCELAKKQLSGTHAFRNRGAHKKSLSLSFKALPQRPGSLRLAKAATCATCTSQWSRDAAASKEPKEAQYYLSRWRSQWTKEYCEEPSAMWNTHTTTVCSWSFFAFECKWESKRNSVQRTTKDHDAAEAKCSGSFCESFNTAVVSVGDLPGNKSAFPE